jgi:hypothetical protein
MAKRKGQTTIQKTGVELRCSGRVDISCSISGTRRVLEYVEYNLYCQFSEVIPPSRAKEPDIIEIGPSTSTAR